MCSSEDQYPSTVIGYPKSDSEWYPSKPSVGQVAFSAVFFPALAGLPLYWAAGESNTGNRIFLWVTAGILLVMATCRIAIGVLLFREGRRRRRIRGL